MSKTYREVSRGNFTSEKTTHEVIKLGSLQRIADAMEVMAKDRVQLERDLKWYKEQYAKRGEAIRDLENQIKGLKSAKSRFKNQLSKQNNDGKT